MKVLIVEDDHATREMYRTILQARGHEVTECEDAEAAWEICQREAYPLIILDWLLPGMDGLQLCRQIRGLSQGDRSLIMVATAREGEDYLQAVLDAGADDYLAKPVNVGLFKIRLAIAEQRVRDLLERKHLQRLLNEKFQFHDLVGKSKPMQLLYQQVREVASVDLTVLIEGETGTGKELVARAVHFVSHRKEKPFIAVNCAGLTESLISSQLFGHRRGAFTGAIQDQQGLLEAAEGGTLLLDEIGDVPMSIQASLLRVLQEKEITRLGETRPRKIDVRILAATHRDLNEEVTKGRFRQDLLYRLRIARLLLPPLRQRREDIPLLVAAFLRECSATSGKAVDEVSPEAMYSLMEYDWPGNVREVKSAIDFAAIRSTRPVIQLEDLPPEINQDGSPQAYGLSASHADEKQQILDALAQVRGNRSAAARLLGMSRSTFYRRLLNLGIAEDS